MSNIFYGVSRDMSFRPDNQKAWLDYLLSVDKRKLVVSVEQEKWVRSASQNRFYWSYLRIIANETGETEDNLHSLFKRLFLPPEFVTILGVEIKRPASTTKLDKIAFGEYMDKICAKTGVPIPDPKLLVDVSDKLEYPTSDESNRPTI
jgi:hypothetical protein